MNVSIQWAIVTILALVTDVPPDDGRGGCCKSKSSISMEGVSSAHASVAAARPDRWWPQLPGKSAEEDPIVSSQLEPVQQAK